MAIDGALTDFALTLERCLPGFQMAHELVSSDRLAASLPQLAELAERRRALIVIDNLESLLSEGGSWRDDRWGLVTGALSGHHGLARVVLTSRRRPAGLAGLQVLSVNALSADEALLLICELPHLRALSQGKILGIDRLASRELARRVLEVAQGHPKLLELADGQAANSERLAALVEAGDQAWRKLGGLPAGFFTTDGEPTAPGTDYLQILAAWTRSVTDTLTPGARDLFWLLCCLEEPDRERPLVDALWPQLEDELGRDGGPPDLDRTLAEVAACGLASIRGEAADGHASYLVHPGVAEAGRGHAGKPFRDAADSGAATFWDAVHRRASGHSADGSVDTGLLVRAGLAAVPYLLRQHQWDHAAALLERGFLRDPSRANAAAVLPAIEQIARHEPRHADLLARVLAVIDPAAAEARLRAYLASATARGDYRTASVATGRLIDLCRDGGRLAEALDLAGQMADYTRQAGLGPWTRRAPATIIARVQFNDYYPLLRLGRTEEALQVLLDCRQAFEDAHDTFALSNTLGALASIESAPSHSDAALRLQRDALRYSYLAGDVDGIAVGYHNLGNYLRRHARQPSPALASHLTAALIRTLTGIGGTSSGSAADSTLQAAADLRELGATVAAPANLADLARQPGDITGTDLPGLIARFSPNAEAAEATLRDLVAQVVEIAAQPPTTTSADGNIEGDE